MLRFAGIAVGALVIALAGLMVIQQVVSRRRAERLLADVRELQLRKSTWEDAQKFMARWKDQGEVEGSCIKAECKYYVTIKYPLDAFLDKHDLHGPMDRWIAFAEFLTGRRFLWGTATLSIRDSIIVDSRYGLFVQVFGRDFLKQEDAYGLVGIAEQEARFVPYDLEWERVLHPEYFIGKPGGCMGCIKLVTQYTPLVDRAKILELTDFNFRCVALWASCRTEADLMPEAGKQFEQEQPGSEARSQAFQQCHVPLDFLGRESENIAIADVVSRQEVRDPRSLSLAMRIRLIQVLKGTTKWPLDAVQQTEVYNRGQEIPGWSSTDIVAGKRYLLLGFFGEGEHGGNLVGLDDCGVIPYTAENLAAIQKGIDESAQREDQLKSR